MTALTTAPAGETCALTQLAGSGSTDILTPHGRMEVRADDSELVLGLHPVTAADGCLTCADRWRADTGGLTATVAGPRSWLSQEPWGSLVSSLLGGRHPAIPRRPGTAAVLHRADASLRTYSYLRHPHCPRCGPPPGPGTTATPLDLRRPQPAAAGVLRVRPVETERWSSRLTDRRHGPVPLTYRDERSPLSLVTTEFVAPGQHRREHGYGRATTFSRSAGPALLEGVERVLGARRAPGVPVITASPRELGDQALDLALLGGHEPDCVGKGRPLAEWTADTVTTWVSAWSAVQEREVLVPEQLAYWRLPHGQRRFVYESSNGCAVGGSLEEAALHGYYEVVERDAFLLTWYSRTRLRRLEGIDDDPQVGYLMDALAAEGLHVDVLDMTSDHQVPTALAVITAPDEVAAADRYPSLSVASATHAEGRQAVRTALEECATNVLMYPRWKTLRESVSMRRCRPMLDDFDRVEVLEDHTGLHGLPEARPLNEFLRHPAGELHVDEFSDRPVADDVVEQLAGHLERLRELGSDLVLVDLGDTTFTREIPVHAVKAIVPGAVPMTFGHRHRRLRGLPRLRRAGQLIQGGMPWSAPCQIVPTPHPFP